MNRYLLTVLTVASIAAVPAHARLSLEQAQELGLATDPMIRFNAGQRALPVITPGVKYSPVENTRAEIARLSEKGSAVYGYLGYADAYRFVPSMCQLDGHAFATVWNDVRYVSDDAIMSAGWIKGD